MDLAVLIACTFLASLLGSFFSSYFKKKGENSATIEDVQEITRRIEDVKMTFTNQSEEIKTKLGVSGKYETEYLTEKRQAYINSFKSMVYWSDLCLTHNPTTVIWGNDSESIETKKRFAEAKFSAHQNFTILRLYNENDSIHEKIAGILKLTLELQHGIEQFFDDTGNIEFYWKNKMENSENKADAHSLYLSERTKLNDLYRKNMLDYSNKIHPARIGLYPDLRALLKTLANKS